jgi:energy-coupling factor transporter ATP-binding protein EcfA2
VASPQWSYPGSRWWKFDFHTHTPASKDTLAWQKAIGTSEELTSEMWLLKYMAAEIDCVAITDHNSGAWIDRLKAAYANMKARADAGQAPEGFRELTLFPGVEISVCGGFHLLAIFEPNSTTRTITDLLAAIDYQGTDGDSDGVTREGPERVIEKIWKAGGIPIPAHADRPDKTGKGLLACRDGSGASCFDANTIRGILDKAQLLAIEWEDMNRPVPECVKTIVEKLTRVLGSDCHSFRGPAVLGSRCTWVKMAKPSLEGLRLALLDGNGVSIRRSDQGAFDPFQIPAHIITTIEIDQAHYMGNGQPAKLGCSPYFNAIVGGRGTGKSTVVQALRLATRREQELKSLGENSEPWEQFEAFGKIAKGRDDKGALRPDTKLRVEWKHEETKLRLNWRADGQGSAVEEWNEERGWQPSASQSINPARFPLRIFSQGQIAAMAGSGRQTLLSIIDEAANVEPLRQAFEEAKRTFFTQRARLRELDGKLAEQAEVARKLDEVGKKLAALSQADHAAVLHAYTLAQHQTREMEALFDQLRDGATRITDLSQHILLDDWPSQHFTQQDAELLAWRRDVEQQVEQVRAGVLEQAQKLRGIIESMREDARVAQWRGRAQVAQQAHTALQQRLAEQGVNDPQAFARLTQERQQLETQHKALQRMHGDRQVLVEQIEAQRLLLVQRRQAITEARQSFIQSALADNPHVQIAVVPFGFEAKQIERELRVLIDVTDERFADDILSIKNGEASGGMAFDLAQADEAGKAGAVDAVKQYLLNVDARLGGRLRNHLQRKHEKPEFADHILAWFPEDDLRIEYQRGGRWISISQGSQGQRSAALLAFLLAFGEEPIVLDQPEDDLDNHLIYDLIVRQIRENKLRRQLIIVTHNPNVVVNGDAELVHVMEFEHGQCRVQQSGALQESVVRREVCRVMEGGHEAFARRWKRLGMEI